MSERWYKEAVIYCVDVETFQDSDGDGCGDLRGLISRLDYLARARRDLPLAQPDPSRRPNRDDGYDVADYYGSTSGSARSATSSSWPVRRDERGIRILLDLVVNHTSDQHPWFRSARSSTRSRRTATGTSGAIRRARRPPPGHRLPRRADTRPGPGTRGRGVVLPPLLRLPARPELGQPGRARGDQEDHGLLAAARRIRASASTPRRSSSSRRCPESTRRAKDFTILDDWRAGPAVAHRRRRAAVRGQRRRRGASRATARAVQRWPERPGAHAVRVHAQPAASGSRWRDAEAEPIVDGLRALPATAGHGAVGDVPAQPRRARPQPADHASSRRTCFGRVRATTADMQLYDRGHPPTAGADAGRRPAHMELAYSLQFTAARHTGAALRRGDRHGETTSSLPGRDAIRTPMQWEPGRTGGFSTAAPSDFARRMTARGASREPRSNVHEQQRDPGSLLRWFERMIRTLRECPEVGVGDLHRARRRPPPVGARPPLRRTGGRRCCSCTTWVPSRCG